MLFIAIKLKMEKDEEALTLVHSKGTKFGTTIEALVEIVESYLGRKFCEEVELLKSDKIEFFEEKLKTSFKKDKNVIHERPQKSSALQINISLMLPGNQI